MKSLYGILIDYEGFLRKGSPWRFWGGQSLCRSLVGGSCLSAGEEFCEKFRLQLLSLIEKIAKLMHPIDGRDFLSRWLCKTPYSKMRIFASFVSFALGLKLLSPKA